LISFPFICSFFLCHTQLSNLPGRFYAPSDFEKGEHFIKAMNNVDRPGKTDSRPTSKKNGTKAIDD